MSDIIFLRAWVAVDLPRFYNPVTNLLAPAAVQARAPKPRGRDTPAADDEEVMAMTQLSSLSSSSHRVSTSIRMSSPRVCMLMQQTDHDELPSALNLTPTTQTWHLVHCGQSVQKLAC